MFALLDLFPEVQDNFNQDPRHMVGWHFRLLVGYNVGRCMVIAIKYGYIPPKYYTVMMRSSFGAAWKYNTKLMLAAAWLYPQHEVLQREIGLAAARRQVDADRYAVTIDDSMKPYVHSMLLPMLHSSGFNATAVADLYKSPIGAGSLNSALIVDDSKAPTPAADMSKPLAVSDPRYATWEKRLSRGRVRISDLAIAMQMSASNDPYVKPRGPFERSFFLAGIILLVPYAVYAARGELFTGHTSWYNLALHVVSNVAGFFNAGSMLLFFVIALFDYFRRSAVQSVLTQLARPVQSDVFKNKVNLLFPFALSRFLSRNAPMDEETAAATMTTAAEGIKTGELDTVLEADGAEDDEDEEQLEPGVGQAVAMRDTNNPVERKHGVPTPLRLGAAHHEEAGTVQSSDVDDGALEGTGIPTEEDAEALIERVMVSTAGADAGSKPPIIDVTRPSNAFAWLRLKELMSEVGLHFQLRMQLYLAVAVLLVLVLDIGAVSRAYGSGTLQGFGHDAETDIIIVQAIVHTVVMLSLVVLCVLLGAYANGQASKQAEALMHAGVELEEVARELQLAVQQRTAGRMNMQWAQGSHGQASSRGTPLPTAERRPSDGSIVLGEFTPNAHAGPMVSTAHEVPQLGLPPSAVGGPGHPPRHGPAVGAGSVYNTARSAQEESAHNVGRAVHGLPAGQLVALLGGIRSAVSSLSTVIQGLRIHAEAHPVRVMGFPATFTLVRVIFTVTFTIVAVFLGGGLGR